MKWSLGVSLVTVLGLVSCGLVRDDDGKSVRAVPQAKTDAGDPDQTPDLDAGVSGETSVDPASDPSSSPPGDAGPTPPEYCVPSCLWNAIRDCTPPAGTVCQSNNPTPGAAVPARVVTCDETTGWSRLVENQGQAGTHVMIARGGVECLSVRSGGANPDPGRSFYRGDTQIAYLKNDGTGARCGGFAASPIVLEPDRPECAPWTGPDAPGLFPSLACTTTVAGDCDLPP